MKQDLARLSAKNLKIYNEWNRFIRQFNGDALKKGFFQGATFELTSFCTLKCPMCYVRLDPKQAEAMGGRHCTAGEWIDLAAQFRDQGGIFLLVTGGEPMMRPDFVQIYNEISRMGIYITLFTNGTTVDDKMLEVLKKRPPAMVGLSLYGSSEETYRKFSGGAGNFQRAVDGLDRLLTIPNLAIEIKFTACSENYRDFQGVYELAARRNKLISLGYGNCAPVRGACSDARKLRLSDEQMKELRKQSKEILVPIMNEYEKLCGGENDMAVNEQGDGNSVPSSFDERRLNCNGGRSGVYIAWDGRMYPCEMADHPYAFPLQQGFKEAAFDIRRQIDSLLLPEKCLSCANRKSFCSCIPKALNEIKDCDGAGEKCNYIPIGGNE